MHIAVIGAGFAGLSIAWHLLEISQEYRITVFDAQGVGGGASGIAAGLLHPYVGERGRRSLYGSQGLQATQELIAVANAAGGASVVIAKGIIRYFPTQAIGQKFFENATSYHDVIPWEGSSYLVTSGCVIDCPLYLARIWHAVHERGGELVQESVQDLSALSSFDAIVLAGGAGVMHWPECAHLRLNVTKGQVLTCQAAHGMKLLENSYSGNGYFAQMRDRSLCQVGSTYERGYATQALDVAYARSVIFPKVAPFFPDVYSLDVVECKAGLRISRVGHYAPIVGKVSSNVWVFTGLGSRGLLYHAYLGKCLARAMHEDNLAKIPKEFAPVF